MKCETWKVCVVVLTLASIFVLIFVMKLVFDKATRDTAETEATKLVNAAETSLESSLQRIIRRKWAFQIGNETIQETMSMRRMEPDYEDVLEELKLNVTQRVAWRSFNRTSNLGQKVHIIRSYPVFLLVKSKLKVLEEIIQRHLTFLEMEERKLRQKSDSKPFYPMPKFVTFCSGRRILSQSEWGSYLNAIGREAQAPYFDFLKLMNEEAVLNKAPSPTDYWISAVYETRAAPFRKLLNSILIQLSPLYREFHAHLRGEIRFLWEVEGISKNGPIPAHIYENLNSAAKDGRCSQLYEATRPYPDKPIWDLGGELRRRRYTPRSMLTFADDFISSLGFPMMPPSFWSESIFRRPQFSPNFNCTPQLFLLDGKREFRLSICGETNEITFFAVNRLMVEAAMTSALVNQTFLHRQFANLQIRESISEGLLLAMQNPVYFRRMGVLEEYEDDISSILNSLYKELVQIFPMIMRSLVFHHWGWDVYRKNVKPRDYSKHYWKLRWKYEGVSPKESRDAAPLDPAAYLNAFQTPAQSIQPALTAILKYAVLNSLCTETRSSSGSMGSENASSWDLSLLNCDLFGRVSVGDRLSFFLQSASSVSWQKNVEMLVRGSNSTYLDASGFLRYFQPLFQYFKVTNKRRELFVGW